MLDFLVKMIDNGNLIDIISCVFTIVALIFTLYLWLLDQVSDEESDFIKEKSKLLETLNKSLDEIKDPKCIAADIDAASNMLLQVISNVNKQMEVVLSYRFWARGKQKDVFFKINDFFRDSKYAVSTIRRSLEKDESSSAGERSLVSITPLGIDELEDIRSDYHRGLSFTIEFIENWE